MSGTGAPPSGRTAAHTNTATPVSGCVIAFREADRIEDCVRSLDFCDEVVVVDSGSDDRTRERAEALGARVVVNQPFPGYREQKQLAVDLANNDWVMCLDADERITPELRERLVRLINAGLEGTGYITPRRNHYLGRAIKAGLFWPDRKLRLFDRRLARWGGDNPHDRVEPVNRDGEALLQRLDEPIQHLCYRDFAHHRRTIDSFTRISAEALYEKGRRATPFDLLMRPPAVAIKSLILKRGFIDGWRGFLIAGMAFWYESLKYWRLLAIQRRAR